MIDINTSYTIDGAWIRWVLKVNGHVIHMYSDKHLEDDAPPTPGELISDRITIKRAIEAVLGSVTVTDTETKPCDGHDWFDCSNAVIPPPAKSCRKCGWTCGDDETSGLFIKWPWMTSFTSASTDGSGERAP